MSYQLCTLGFLPPRMANPALLRVLPSCPNSPEDGAVRCFRWWLVNAFGWFQSRPNCFRKIEPWEGPICHLVPISRKMGIICQVLAFLFSIIKGVGRVVPVARLKVAQVLTAWFCRLACRASPLIMCSAINVQQDLMKRSNNPDQCSKKSLQATGPETFC